MRGSLVLLLDVSNIAYRTTMAARGNQGWLKKSGLAQERLLTVYLFLREIGALSRFHHTVNFVFCFDDDYYARREVLGDYKPPAPPDKRKERAAIREEIAILRKDVLPELGYENLFRVEGGEADDVIGLLCLLRPEKHKYMIVSNDRDMYQLLEQGNVTIYNPHTKAVLTEDWLKKEHQLNAEQYVRALAITGCDGDNVPGIEGVGLIRAAMYIRGKLPEGVFSQRIRDGEDIIRRNMDLVTIPYPPLESPYIGNLNLKNDNVTPEVWDDVMRKYNMVPLIGKCPV